MITSGKEEILDYYTEYEQIKSRWADLTMKPERTDEEKRVLWRIDVLADIADRIKAGDPGAIPLRMARCCFGNFTADHAALDTVRGYADNKAERYEAGVNLVIQGPVGVGKTHLAVALAWELMTTKPKRYSLDFWSIVDFVELAKRVYNRDAEAAKYAAGAPKIDWLVIDDLGQERPTEWTRELIYSLVARRYNAAKPTIVTTNLTAAEIAERYGDPVASRIFGSGSVVLRIAGKDKRMGGDQ